jgi:16S rRNA (cytosine967-C5)-methyltransferase
MAPTHGSIKANRIANPAIQGHKAGMLPSARRAAAALVSAVLDDGRSLADALIDTPAYIPLEGRDRAFARAIASACLRRLGGIDAILARFLTSPLPETATVARAILRTGAAQLLVLATPAHAAVSESVEIAGQLRQSRGFAKLINAVLRKVAGVGPAALADLAPGVDLPDWLYARWRAAHGETLAAAIALALRDEPPLDLVAKTDAAALASSMVDGGFEARLTASGAVRLPTGAPITALPGFAEGAFWVQDEAASLPARLLGPIAGLRVLDLCAAPGGKTMQLAAAGARVTAVDSDAARLERLRANLTRTGLQADSVCADVLTYRPEAPFDAVLLDAPCTATGTLRRRPDAAFLRRPSDIPALAATQTGLLAAAADMLRPGGRLVYAVCSLEPEEGPAVVAAALASGAWAREALTPEDVFAQADLITQNGDLFTAPALARGTMDGFYAARLVKP